MNYKRLTKRRETPLTMSMWAGDSESLKVYNRLVQLEDKIENGELISTIRDEQSEQDIMFFIKYDAKVCEEVVKECLQVLRDTRIARICDDFSWGWDNGIDEAIEQLAKKYCIDEEDDK